MSGWTLAELADRVAGEVAGDPGTRIEGVARWQEAGPHQLAVVYSQDDLDAAEQSPAGALIIPSSLTSGGKPALRVKRPRLAWAVVLQLFAPPDSWQPGIHATAVLGEEVELGAGVSVGPYAVIGPRARVGENSRIGAHCVLGTEVTIGRDCLLYPRVTLYDRVELGERVILHSGVVLGADGFGYERVEEGYLKIPQVGCVVIEDDVEIGPNTTVDRATVGVTRIGAGTKIDNLVQVGHNVEVGRGCILVAQVGIAGSTVLEDDAALGGQVGLSDHLRIGRGAQVAAKAGVMNDIPPGAQWFGIPAQPRREAFRTIALQRRLPELYRRMKELEERLAEMQEGRGEDVHGA